MSHSELITKVDAGKLPWLALSFVWLISDRFPQVICCWGLDTARFETWFRHRTGNQATGGKVTSHSPTWAKNTQESAGLFWIRYFAWLAGRHADITSEKGQHNKKGPGEYEKSWYWQIVFLTPGRNLFYEGIICSCVSPWGLWKFGRFPLTVVSPTPHSCL